MTKDKLDLSNNTQDEDIELEKEQERLFPTYKGQPQTKIHVRLGFDITIPFDHTTEYKSYKEQVDHIHLVFKTLVYSLGDKRGYKVDKYLLDSYPIGEDHDWVED